MLLTEEWRDIPGWPNYQASNLGRIKRLAGFSIDGKRRLRERILKQRNDPSRRGSNYIYTSVQLGNSEHHEPFSVARLVLLAFVGPPGPGEECRHLNDISTDCKLSNLAWGTRLENRQDAVNNGRMAKGERNGMAKLTESDIAAIRSRYKPYDRLHGSGGLARDYGVAPGTISDIISKRSWKEQQ